MIALWRGSFGSYDAITSGTLVRATPVMLTGLSVAIAFRAGVFNIGAEGQFLAGAAAATSLSMLPVLGASYASSPLALVAGAVAAALAAWWILKFTAAGFRLRAVGANADASRSAGMIDVSRTTTQAFVVSGALAGLAGAIELTGVTFALYENISPGYGYTGIAVALLARLDAAGVVASGLLFGALDAGASAMQRDAGVPSVVVSMIEAVIILGLIVAWPL